MRLFFAVPLPEVLREALGRLQGGLRGSGPAGSWPDPAGLHLTLAFLGELEEDRVPALLALAERAVVGRPPVPLRTAQLGGFPRPSSARVLWLGLEPQPALDALAATLRGELRVAGVPFDAKAFRPHLTLARFRRPQDVSLLGPAPAPTAFEAGELALFQSLGGRYRVLGRALLSG